MRVLKRGFDILVSLTLLVLLSPLMLIAILMVWGALGRPIFFYQQRPGFHGKPFRFIKFRTMRNAYDNHGHALPDEARMTPVGSWIRKLSLDELPQLWLVLKGKMSLVGPRPLLMEYLPLYNEEQNKRHLMKPGITGWAQVNGRNAIDWPEKFRLDVWYVENWSFALDMKILWSTFWHVISRKNISAPGQVTMTAFKGNG